MFGRLWVPKVAEGMGMGIRFIGLVWYIEVYD